MTEYGTDVSHWNTVSDWNAVRGNGISFASIKITESVGYVSPDASAQANGARNAGIAVGGYHFARNDATPEAQARFFASECQARGLLQTGSFVPMLDLESVELRSSANTFTRRFITAFRVYSGQSKVAVYSNTDWFRNVLDMSWADTNVFLWIAAWNGDPGNPGWSHPRLALHQHTDAGTVPGVGGTVDRDCTVAPFTLAELLVGNGSVPLTTTTSAPGDIVFQFLADTDSPKADPTQPLSGTNGFTRVTLMLGGGLLGPATWADVHAKDKAWGGDGTGSVLGVGAAEYQAYVTTDAAVRAAVANLEALTGAGGGATPAQVTAIVDEAFAHHNATLVYNQIASP